MNIAIILAGGTGTRLGTDIPKQYIVVGNEPVFMYCLRAFQVHRQVDKIVIVAAHEWQNFIQEWIQKKQIDNFCYSRKKQTTFNFKRIKGSKAYR